MTAYYVPDRERKTCVVSFADVEGCNDVDQLSAWMDEFAVIADDIKAQWEARKLFETADDQWAYDASRAMATFKQGVGHCKRRLKALGAIRHEWVLGAELDRIGKKLSLAKVDTMFVTIARETLSPEAFNSICDAVSAKLTAPLSDQAVSS